MHQELNGSRNVVVRGFVKKLEVREFGQDKRKMATGYVECGKNRDKVNVVVFPTRNDPQRAVNFATNFKEGDFVYLLGSLEEQVYVDRNNQEQVNYQIVANTWNFDSEQEKPGSTTFNVTGIVESKKGKIVTVVSTEMFTRQDGTISKNSKTFNFTLDENMRDKFEYDIEKGSFIYCGGRILNSRQIELAPLEEGMTKDMRIPNMGNMVKSDKVEKALEVTFLKILKTADEVEDLNYEEDSLSGGEIDMDDVPF